jgi:beta-lactam-binding protein with PASTA domain
MRVPNVVGLSWSDAQAVLRELSLVGMGFDPDAAPLGNDVTGTVVDQSPESGARVPPGSAVRLWLDRGNGGVREPRRPKPSPRTGRVARLEPSDEAVG